MKPAEPDKKIIKKLTINLTKANHDLKRDSHLLLFTFSGNFLEAKGLRFRSAPTPCIRMQSKASPSRPSSALGIQRPVVTQPSSPISPSRFFSDICKSRKFSVFFLSIIFTLASTVLIFFETLGLSKIRVF